MHMTNLRKVGESVMLTLPPAILDVLNLKAGAAVGVAIEGDNLIVQTRPKPHYTLEELLAASDYDTPQGPEEREWIDAPSVGRELI